MATPKRDRPIRGRALREERKGAFARKGRGDGGAALWDAYQDIEALEASLEMLQEENRELVASLKRFQEDNIELEAKIAETKVSAPAKRKRRAKK